MFIQLQFSEIMGCANLFQRFLTLAVYCVSTPSILLTRVHVTWLVHKWRFINTCAIWVICYVLKHIQYTAKVKNLWNKFAQPMISLNWSWINIYYSHFIHQFKWTLRSRSIFSISGFHSRYYVQGCFTFWGKK
jgi:hypothetical protein